MDRRDFLKSSGLTTIAGLAATGLTASASLAGTELSGRSQILLVTTADPTSDLHTDLIARRIAENVEAATGGRFQIVASPDQGIAALTLTPVSSLIERNPAWATFMPLVHGLGPQAFDGWLRAAGGAMLVEELAHDTQLTVLPVGRAAAPRGFFARSVPAGNTAVLAPDARSLMSGENGEICFALQSGFGGKPEFALPAPLAGEPVVMTIRRDVMQSLASEIRTIIRLAAAAEYGRVSVETDVQIGLIANFGNQPDQKSASPGLLAWVEATIAGIRDGIGASGDIARQILESQAGYRTVTTGIVPGQIPNSVAG